MNQTHKRITSMLLSGAHPGVAMGYLAGGTEEGGGVSGLPGGSWTQSGNRMLGANSGADTPCVTVNGVYYPTLEGALAAILTRFVERTNR